MGVDRMVLRGYRPEDLEALHALDVLCFEPLFRFSRATMRRFAVAAKARVVIAEAGGQVAGFCIVHVERDSGGRMGYVVTLDVAPQYRRHGLAQALMAEAERQCLAAGCSAMGLHVFVGNAAAVRFYARCGYVFSGVEEGFYGAGLDAEIWGKRLASEQQGRDDGKNVSRKGR